MGALAGKLAATILPVLLFLFLLRALDSFKLLTLGRTLLAIGAGCLAAAASYLVNSAFFSALGPAADQWARFGAPPVEEALKAAYVVWLVRARRVGFMVDAAIAGFSVGAGFALIENLTYVRQLAGSPLIWALRGFGTAMMHGGTTAIFGMLSSSRAERANASGWRTFAPGSLAAIAIHTVYNLGVAPPLVSAVAALAGLPPLMGWIFLRGEDSLRKWLGDRLDKDMDLLRLISGGEFAGTNAGKYLRSLQASFRPEIVADMLCYVQLSTELSVAAKGDLLMREAGFPTPPDPQLPSKLQELRYLERSIGPAGRLAINPLLPAGARVGWEIDRLSSGLRRAGP
ncbi:MAG: PrsW family intramembrane metalloprotease [Bryobacteraceae bacterium]|nr:PrsW family intramembrane metalloprotease [Bryobacteraceae bacterium]